MYFKFERYIESETKLSINFNTRKASHEVKRIVSPKRAKDLEENIYHEHVMDKE